MIFSSGETIHVAAPPYAVLDRIRKTTTIKGVTSAENLKRDFFGEIGADSFDIKIYGWFLQVGIRVVGSVRPGAGDDTSTVVLDFKLTPTEKFQLILYIILCALFVPLMILAPDPLRIAKFALGLLSYGAYIAFSRHRARSKIRRAIRGE
ncbi:MAG: hypothetical protein NXI24_20900 [bacterium]|nr:hypothetical protein [bacterium]